MICLTKGGRTLAGSWFIHNGWDVPLEASRDNGLSSGTGGGASWSGAVFGLLDHHRDNEAVLTYLVEEAPDIDWMVHRSSL